jgi:hypothetical protein
MIPESELPMVKDSTMVPHAVPLELPMKGASSSRHVTTMIPGLGLPMNHVVIPGEVHFIASHHGFSMRDGIDKVVTITIE